MERRVTSPTWGPPPPCKQALTLVFFCARGVGSVYFFYEFSLARCVHLGDCDYRGFDVIRFLFPYSQFIPGAGFELGQEDSKSVLKMWPLLGSEKQGIDLPICRKK